MNTKHTPGPWQLILCDSGDITVTYTDGEIRSHVATCHHLVLAPEHGELLNNARLIAAAPDLLEALQRISEACALPESNGVTLTPEAMLTAIGRLARAAIAKAEGTA